MRTNKIIIGCWYRRHPSRSCRSHSLSPPLLRYPTTTTEESSSGLLITVHLRDHHFAPFWSGPQPLSDWNPSTIEIRLALLLSSCSDLPSSTYGRNHRILCTPLALGLQPLLVHSPPPECNMPMETSLQPCPLWTFLLPKVGFWQNSWTKAPGVAGA